MKIMSCNFNMDTGCVELKFFDGSMLSIDCTGVDYLIYSDPVSYAELILNGNPEIYLKTVTEYKIYDS